jgi:OmcA/MtrC family decaheme c-type cytochrome
VLNANITSVTLDEDNRPIVEWQLTDGNGVAIVDLTAEDVRFTIAKLQASPLGNLTGTWQSYINRIREPDPDEGPGTADRLQATYERNADGSEFTNNGDGTYRYHFALSLSDLGATEGGEEVLAQAEVEGLNLDYEPNRPHRLAMQFGNSEGWANPVYDWVPATGTTTGSPSMDIAATANCNRCHDPLMIHGSGRREVKYCVTCHNPGSTDPSSTNTVDMKVMIHKIHMGSNLPSVEDGGEYIVGGHDYSTLNYPQDIRNCVNCHAGTLTGAGREDELTLTNEGDNWTQYPTRATCGSCHDDVNLADHQDGQPDDSKCASCHDADSIQNSHLIPAQEARAAFKAELLSVTNTGAGDTPEAEFRITNPLTGEDYDILNNPVWQNSSSRLRVRFAWNTADYTNTGNQEDDANSVAADAKEDAIPNGDGSYRISAPVPIPDQSVRPGIAASGSGVVVIEGRAVVESGVEDETRASLTNVHEFFSIDEPDGDPVERRQAVTIENCQACHVTISHHGGSRADNIDSCVTCHNPRNTDREDREGLEEPPVDGLAEQSVDFKVLIHGIHAAGIREVPLQVEDTVFDEEEVRYPGNLANCVTCHTEEGFQLPLASTVLGTSIDTGDDLQDPSDDLVTTPITAVCSSCHDDDGPDSAKSHMRFNGGNFSTTQAAIDSGEVHEDCNSCHKEGSGVADAWEVHQRYLN